MLAFKVKVQPKFRNVVVLKYSTDLNLINTIIDLLPDAEVLFCKLYSSTYWDTHILCLCSFHFLGSQIVPVYVMQTSSKTHIPLPDSNDPPYHESVS